MLMRFKNPVADWLFPRRCLACGQDMEEDTICRCCLSLINRCPSPSPMKVTPAALFYYELVIKDLLIGAKFNRRATHAHLLLMLVKDELARSTVMEDIRSFSPSIITAVPTHWINRMRRGIDLPSLLAQALSAMLGVKARSLLGRRGFLKRQAMRSKRAERQKAIGGSFRLKKTAVSYERILLVDDIVTTGATLAEATRMLRCLSPDIRCLAIAKTP